MSLLAATPADAFNDVIFKLIIPAIFAAAIVGILLSLFVKGFSNFLIRIIRPSRGAGSGPRSGSRSAHGYSVRQTAVPPPYTPDAMDGTAPHCPICNRVMVARTARRGARQGSSFWGCLAYPDCRGTRET